MSFWDNVKDTVADITSLEVITFTGKVSAVVKDSEGGSLINWEALIDLAKEGGEVQLVGATKVELDKDVRQFLDSTAPQKLIDLHLETVHSSMEARQAFISLISDKLLN